VSRGAWICPPECQGQMVIVEYTDTYDGQLWRRVTDRSDGEPLYSVAAAECRCWEPWNREPTACDWQPSSAVAFRAALEAA
jgi:hypothetical protein